MRLYKDTITLFNRYVKEKTVYWYPSILKGVNLNIDKATIIAKYGAESKDNAVLNVRYRIMDDGIMVGGKRFLLPKEWKRQEEDNLSKSLTFATDTNDFDFFYVGEWENEDLVKNDDYANGFYSYMNKTFDQVFAITSVAQYSVIPHFEVVAK